MIISWQCLPLLLSTPLWDFRMIRTAGPSSGGTCRGGFFKGHLRMTFNLATNYRIIDACARTIGIPEKLEILYTKVFY